VDFWPQHKDFVLKVLAGFGVFLVALIARGITFGDELENASRRNRARASGISRIKLATPRERREIAQKTEKLKRNISAMGEELGWDRSNDRIEIDLIRRALGYMGRYRRGGTDRSDEIAAAAAADWEAIKANLNGGFPQLRLKVRDSLVEEASEKNIQVREGIGFQSVLQIEQEELLKYLMQLELAARLVRACIDAEVIAVDEVRIDTQRSGREPIVGANPELLEEYPVTIRFRGSQEAMTAVLNEVGTRRPQVPVRGLLIDRLQRPPDAVGVELTVLALAFDARVPFEAEEKKDR